MQLPIKNKKKEDWGNIFTNHESVYRFALFLACIVDADRYSRVATKIRPRAP